MKFFSHRLPCLFCNYSLLQGHLPKTLIAFREVLKQTGGFSGLVDVTYPSTFGPRVMVVERLRKRPLGAWWFCTTRGAGMDNLKRNEKNLFEELGLQVTEGQVKVGSTYPIFGMITQLSSDGEGKVIAEINHHIHARMNFKDESRLEVLRGKAFETGIFISTVIAVEPTLEVECQAVIFGKNQAYHA